MHCLHRSEGLLRVGHVGVSMKYHALSVMLLCRVLFALFCWF